MSRANFLVKKKSVEKSGQKRIGRGELAAKHRNHRSPLDGLLIFGKKEGVNEALVNWKFMISFPFMLDTQNAV